MFKLTNDDVSYLYPVAKSYYEMEARKTSPKRTYMESALYQGKHKSFFVESFLFEMELPDMSQGIKMTKATSDVKEQGEADAEKLKSGAPKEGITKGNVTKLKSIWKKIMDFFSSKHAELKDKGFKKFVSAYMSGAWKSIKNHPYRTALFAVLAVASLTIFLKPTVREAVINAAKKAFQVSLDAVKKVIRWASTKLGLRKEDTDELIATAEEPVAA